MVSPLRSVDRILAEGGELRPDPGVAHGGGASDDGGMRERLARLEALLPTLATRSDVAELRTEIERGQKENRAWMLATVLGLFVGILAVGSFFFSGLKLPPASAAQPPIIITVPAQPPPDPAPATQP